MRLGAASQNSLCFSWVPLEGQVRIVRGASAHDARIRAEEACRGKLKLLKKGLMDDLLTGRVRVHTDAGGEP
jgi:hypothetical protein